MVMSRLSHKNLAGFLLAKSRLHVVLSCILPSVVEDFGSESFLINQLRKKPPEVRMGGGKGDVHEYVAPVKNGRILFEMGGVSEEVAREALRLAMHKLPIKTKILSKSEL
jgi:hypothetical protein